MTHYGTYDYRYLTEQPCKDCLHVHPKDEACVIGTICSSCGRPAGLVSRDVAADGVECSFCYRERVEG